jgi:D-glycero-D-manno-heptose 1,7-bisphosphate phosphatase
LELELNASWFIGDARSDIQAALHAGCRPLLVLTGRGTAQLATLSAEERAA